VFYKGKNKKGFTIFELVVVIAVAGLIFAITLFSFSNLRDKESLDKTALQISSIIDQARSKTLASKNDSVYGVHIDTTEIVLFKGLSYSQSSVDNVVFSLNPNVEVISVDLSDSGSDIVFERLTGKAMQSGTTTLSLKKDTSQETFVVVQATGLVNVTR